MRKTKFAFLKDDFLIQNTQSCLFRKVENVKFYPRIKRERRQIIYP